MELRREALERLRTHHLSGNHEIAVDGARAECQGSMVIWRKTEDDRVLNTHCLYLLEMSKAAAGWQISSIIVKP